MIGDQPLTSLASPSRWRRSSEQTWAKSSRGDAAILARHGAVAQLFTGASMIAIIMKACQCCLKCASGARTNTGLYLLELSFLYVFPGHPLGA